MSAVILPFVPRPVIRDTRSDDDKYAAALALQTGQEDPRCDTHWRITLEREFWPRNEAPAFYETQEEADALALYLDKTIGGMVDVIPPGWVFYD